jgi:hypothetical protein
MTEEERYVTAEEYELLSRRGFFERRGWDGLWQRGGSGLDHGPEPVLYTTEEALEVARAEEGEQNG